MARSDGTTPLIAIPDGETYDLVVAGSGAGGLAAAFYAGVGGARVLLVEREETFGGSTAYTAGTLWIPGTREAQRDGAPANDVEEAAAYLDLAVGSASDPALRRAFLDAGRDAVAALVDNSQVQLKVSAFHPDYMAYLDHSVTHGRTLEPVELNGAELGSLLGRVREQTSEFTVFGGLMLARQDIADFSDVARTFWKPRVWPKAVRAAALLARHLVTRPFHARATRMTMGNALVGRFMLSLREQGVTLLPGASIEELVVDDGQVTGVVLSQGSVTRLVKTRAGLISATGGLSQSSKRREELLPGVAPEWSPGAPGNTATLHELILDAGGVYGPELRTNAFWAPVSLPKRRGGDSGVFPRFALDRGKPGFMVVDQNGHRYLDESTWYHDFCIRILERDKISAAIPSWLIADAAAVTRYGIGAVRPGGWGLRKRIREGYVVSGRTLEELASAIGADAGTLNASVETINEYALTGSDPDFHRGETVYQRHNGDATHAPNPSIGALKTGPYYAVRLYPGDIGSCRGFATDSWARVLDEAGIPIRGLYAVGVDAQSVMGDTYPGPGVTLGPAVVFAYLAAQSALDALNA